MYISYLVIVFCVNLNGIKYMVVIMVIVWYGLQFIASVDMVLVVGF